jgi:hypothetical protein
LADLLQNSGADMVVGGKTRKNPWPYGVLSKVSNRITRGIAGMELSDMNCPVRVMRSAVAKGLPLAPGLDRFIPWIASLQGFKAIQADVANRPRQSGLSHFGAEKYLFGAMDLAALKAATIWGKGAWKISAAAASASVLCSILCFYRGIAAAGVVFAATALFAAAVGYRSLKIPDFRNIRR